MRNLADRHLTYIPFGAGYRVYPSDGGPQLGHVEQRPDNRAWRALSFDRPGIEATGDARWVAATLMWPEDGVPSNQEEPHG